MTKRRSVISVLQELWLPRDERAAAGAERRVEREMRRQRDNKHTEARRAEAIEAESRRHSGSWPGTL